MLPVKLRQWSFQLKFGRGFRCSIALMKNRWLFVGCKNNAETFELLKLFEAGFLADILWNFSKKYYVYNNGIRGFIFQTEIQNKNQTPAWLNQS